jgi:O-antigen biosynthesis protein
MPKISVIIPCYNQGHFIDEAVESVLNQTFQDFEIIIVNDGSTDESTISKLSEYIKPKTKVVHTENYGLSAARNTGLLNADGDFIQFLDADDTILSAKFEEQLAIFREFPETEVCYTNFRIFDTSKNTILTHPSNQLTEKEPLTDFLFRWERGLSIPIHCALFRRKVWGQELPFNEELKAREDWLMWCNLAVRKARFHFLDKEFAVYRFHENNMSKNIVEMNYTFILSSYYILQIIPEDFKKKFLKEVIVQVNKSLENNLYPDLVNQIYDLKNKFNEMEKTIDYKIGNLILKPYRFLKTKISGKKYL